MSLATFFHSWEGFLPPNAVIMGRPLAQGASAAPHGATPLATAAAFAARAYVQVSEPLRGETQDLLRKILQAIGLRMEDVAVGAAPMPPGTAPFWIGFGVGASAPSGVRAVFTHSLENLLTNPQLKREAWHALKSATA